MSDVPFGRRTTVDDDIDLDDDDVSPVAELTDLQALAAELGAEVERDPITLEVPARPGYAVRYDTNLRFDQLQEWRKRAKDKSPLGMNLLVMSALILANQCQAIIRHGADVELDGETVTFASESFRRTLGVGQVRACVISVYGVDPHVIAAAQSVVAAAGYDDDIAEVGSEDPTRR